MTTDPAGFWARCASDVGADAALAQVLDSRMPEAVRLGLLHVLDVLADCEFTQQPQDERQRCVASVTSLGTEAAAGVRTLCILAAMLAYSLPDAHGHNPFWAQFGYPGPLSAPPPEPKPIAPFVPVGDTATLEADVVVVGSGAGGGVIAGELAGQGKAVVVLEAGGYYNEADFIQSELWAHEHLFYRGGPTWTGDGNVVLFAGATLGGGTTVNWMNCVRLPACVRIEWTRDYGLEGLDGPAFDQHLASVLQRIGANTACSDHNGPNLRLKAAANALGYSWHVALCNADQARYMPALAGYTHFGDRSGCKQGTMKTYLQDAYDQGARILVRTRADRILVQDGRATGVTATYMAGEHATQVTVQAGIIVVAGGALESPALLVRSNIGGPAVGKYLHLHPVIGLDGVYDEDQQAWWGPPQSGVLDEFANMHDGYGYLVECSHYYPGIYAAQFAHLPGTQHKELMAQFANISPFLAILRDRSCGHVAIDETGDSLPFYTLTDLLDQRRLKDSIDTLARLHKAAGAREIHSAIQGVRPWRRGEDLESFIAAMQAIPVGAGGLGLGSAHQMGSCRMGRDPRTSVADPWGQLHDVKGVWIGDASAFPTASGANPMLTCMALARRTAGAILAS